MIMRLELEEVFQQIQVHQVMVTVLFTHQDTWMILNKFVCLEKEVLELYLKPSIKSTKIIMQLKESVYQ